VTLALESRHKGSNALSIQSPVVDEESFNARPLVWSMHWHCRLCDRKDIWKKCTHLLPRVCSETGGERKL